MEICWPCRMRDGEKIMASINLYIAAGIISTTLFAVSNIPMLTKAARTRNLKSYSFPHIVFSNVGNLVHWIYIADLPFGPIWFLHTFYTITAMLMLVWYLRYEGSQWFTGPQRNQSNLCHAC
jgi:hypothetical protein